MRLSDPTEIQNAYENIFSSPQIKKFPDLETTIEELSKSPKLAGFNNQSTRNTIFIRNLYNLKANLDQGLQNIVKLIPDESYFCIMAESPAYIKKMCQLNTEITNEAENSMEDLSLEFMKLRQEILIKVSKQLINGNIMEVNTIKEFIENQEKTFKTSYDKFKLGKQKPKVSGFFDNFTGVFKGSLDTSAFEPLYEKLQKSVADSFDKFIKTEEIDFHEITSAITSEISELDGLMFLNIAFFYRLADDLIDKCLERLKTDKFVFGKEIIAYKFEILKNFDDHLRTKISENKNYQNVEYHIKSIWQAFSLSLISIINSQTETSCNNYKEFKIFCKNVNNYAKTAFRKVVRSVFKFDTSFYLVEKHADKLVQVNMAILLALKSSMIDDGAIIKTLSSRIQEDFNVNKAIKFVKGQHLFYSIVNIIESVSLKTKFYTDNLQLNSQDHILYFSKKFGSLVDAESSEILTEFISDNSDQTFELNIQMARERVNTYRLESINEVFSLISLLIHLFVNDVSRLIDLDWKYTSYYQDILFQDALVKTLNSFSQDLISRHELKLGVKEIFRLISDNHSFDLEKIIKTQEEYKMEYHTIEKRNSQTFVIGISGFLSEDTDKIEEWNQLAVHCGAYDIIALNWRAGNVYQLKDNFLPKFSENVSKNYKKTDGEGVSKNIFTTFNFVSDLYKDNPFINAYNNSAETGKHFCKSLLHAQEFKNHRQLNIVSFSLGTVITHNFLLSLEEARTAGNDDGANKFYVGDVLLMGSCVDHKRFLETIHKLIGYNGIVKGRLIVAFTKNDAILKYLFKMAKFEDSPLGYNSVPVDDVAKALQLQDPYLKTLDKFEVENIAKAKYSCYDFTDIVEGHMDYRNKLSYVLKVVGFKNSYDFLDDTYILSR